MKFFFRTLLIPFVLVPLLIGQPIWAQAPLLSPAEEEGGGANLQLKIISADNARVPVNSRSTKGFTIQVTDLHGAPVPEAAVAVRLPDSGSSGTFGDGSHSAVVYTDSAGTAHVGDIQWSETPGTAVIRIIASKGSEHAGLLVEQTLVVPGASSVPVLAEPIRSAPLPPSPAVLGTPAPSVSVESTVRKDALGSDMRFDRPISANPIRPEAEPSVSIVSSRESNSVGSSKKKWIILGIVVAAGAGAGFAFAHKGSQSGSTAATSSSISFGSPTVSVGHP